MARGISLFYTHDSFPLTNTSRPCRAPVRTELMDVRARRREAAASRICQQGCRRDSRFGRIGAIIITKQRDPIF